MKNLVKVFSIVLLALGIVTTAMPMKASAAPAAKSVYSYEIMGMADQDMYNRGQYGRFPQNAVVTDGTSYVKIKQMGYGSRFVNIDGNSVKLQEVESKPITEYTPYGRIIGGWYIVYRIPELSEGVHDIEFGCTGSNFPSRTIRDYAKIKMVN